MYLPRAEQTLDLGGWKSSIPNRCTVVLSVADIHIYRHGCGKIPYMKIEESVKDMN